MFRSLPAFSHFLCYLQANWVLIPGWVVSFMFQDPVGLSSKLSCEAKSFSRRLNPRRVLLDTGFEALFLHTGTCLGCVVCLAPRLFLLVYPHTNVGLPVCQPPHPPKFSSHHVSLSPLHPAAHLCHSYQLDECFFFNSLVVGLPIEFNFQAVLVIFCF